MKTVESFQETEVRFLEIDKESMTDKLRSLKAEDLGERLLTEVIFYDKGGEWLASGKKFVRLRQDGDKTQLTYKEHNEHTIDGTVEIELEVSDLQQATAFLEKLNLVAVRHQEKRRHSFKLDKVIVDIDTWPQIPTYVELEGSSEKDLKEAAKLLDLDWQKAVFENARTVIEKYYKIPVGKLRYFTFNRVEL